MNEHAEKSNTTESYDSRIIQVRRTAKVRDGGKDFSFSAIAVVGDGKGRIGYACGKAKEVIDAVKQANDRARRNMYTIALRGDTLQYPVKAKFGATKVFMRPAAPGTGIIAGGALRSVFEVMGVKNVIAKCIKSKNPLNVVKASIEGLVGMISPGMIAEKRGKTVKEIVGHHHDSKRD